MARKSKLSIPDREEAVLGLLRKEEPVAALSRRYQVSEQTLYRWRDEFLTAGRQGLAKMGRAGGEGQKRVVKLEKELAKRAQVIGSQEPRTTTPLSWC